VLAVGVLHRKIGPLRQINSYIERIINQPDWEFAGIYYDFGKSGLRKKGRCGLEKMLKAVDKEEIDYILTRSVSRLSRDTLEVLTIIRYLRKRGINMHFDNENLDSISLVAEGYITLAGAVAQEESRNMSENMQWSNTRKFEHGIFTNYKSFMGYKCVEGELVIVPEQAEVIRDIFELYLSGKTFKQIKEYLEKQKIKTATGKSQWDVTTIQKMLKNEKYKGDSLLQKTYTKDYINGIREKKEVAKLIGLAAYREAFEKKTCFRYQYQRFEDMIQYTQDNYFTAKNIDYTDAFAKCLTTAIADCITDFVDAKCIVVY
jgi:site-specific DNA recombinase